MPVALAHLALRLAPVHRALHAAISQRDAAARALLQAGALPHALTRGHVSAVLTNLENRERNVLAVGPASLEAEELTAEARLRGEAASAGTALPLDRFAADLALSPFEVEVLVLCATIEVDIEYERVLGYLHDDPERRAVSVELASALTSSSHAERIERRAVLGPAGKLRRFGLVVHTARETSLRDELRLSPASVRALFGEAIDFSLVFSDPAEVRAEPSSLVPADPALVARAGEALAAGSLDAVGVWGRASEVADVVVALAAAMGRPVRRHVARFGDLARALDAAATLSSLLWIDLDSYPDPIPPDVVIACTATRVPFVVTAQFPWRPSELLARQRYVELPMRAVTVGEQRALWKTQLPELAPELADRAARTFHFNSTEVRAVATTARSLAGLQTNGHLVTPADTLHEACLAVARKHGERHTTMVTPRRGADDLVLAPELHARVLDLVHNFRALPRVMDEWGFAAKVSGAGLKGLFTGEPGTGKTLAAEVVAHELGLPMLRVDLARVVSKWIGETEKNLDSVFAEARDSHAVLFFDEAEALFGARGDVRHGTDRYANLEVSYLLQRFEDHAGIVVLATNLRDKIDPAFMRRFHVVVGFPRPSDKERRRIWQRVFTTGVPVAGDLDFVTLARLDLTGAGIVGAAQNAALLAAREGLPVAMRHIVRGIVRQYQRESRVLSHAELGAHAVHASA